MAGCHASTPNGLIESPPRSLHEGQHNIADVGTLRALNLVEGRRVTLDAADDPTNDRVSVVVNAAPPVDGEITNAIGYVPANLARDRFTGTLDLGPYRTIGGPLEKMAKHSEDFAAAVSDRNGGSCSVASNSIIAPDGNHAADVTTAVTTTPVIHQQVPASPTAALTSSTSGPATHLVYARFRWRSSTTPMPLTWLGPRRLR